MSTRSWGRKLFARPKSSPIRVRPRLEVLEVRVTPAPIVVTSLLDNGDAGTLRWALTQANADPTPDTIDFGVTGTIRLNGTALPDIRSNVTITGPGAASLTIDAQDASRVLQVSAGVRVTVSGLTLANGAAPFGGDVLNAGTLTLLDDVLTGGLANGSASASLAPGSGGRGGGLFNSGNATVLDSTISGSSATGGGPALFLGGLGGSGGGVYNAGTLVVRGSTISANSATGGAGSSYFYNGSQGSGGQGGQGGSLTNAGTLTLTNSTVANNMAAGGQPAVGVPDDTGGQGGGIANFATLVVTNSTLAGNQAENGLGAGGGGGSGGGLVMVGGSATLENTLVATNAAGAGPDTLGTVTSNEYNLIGVIDGSSGWVSTDLTGTQAGPLNPKLGPLQDNDGLTATMALLPGSPAIDAGNSAVAPATDQRGGSRDSHPDIGAYEIVHSVVVTTLLDEDNGSPDPALGSGTSLREALDFANFNSGLTTITFSPSLTLPGTIRLVLGELPVLTGDVAIVGPGARQLTIDAHKHSRVLESAGSATVALSGLTLANGYLPDKFGIEGAGILNKGTLTVTDSTLSGNTAKSGGGIANYGTLTVTNSTLYVNEAFSYGAGLFNQVTLTVTDSTFSSNTAGLYGGGLVNYLGTVILTNSTLSSNNTFYEGGGIFNSLGTVILTNSTLSRNGADYEGGGIYNIGTLTVANSTLSGNLGGDKGGGIRNRGRLTVADSTLSGNYSPQGGGH